MSSKPYCPNHEDKHGDEQPGYGVKTWSPQKEDPGKGQSPGWKANMALPPSGDEESSSNKKTHKRMVHNAVERRRKVKINNHIHILAKLLPNKDGKRWSKNETLEKAVEYIHEIKNAHDKMMMGKLDEVHAAELTRMKCRIKELEKQNSTYAKLLEIAGIPPKADCSATSWDPSSLGEKLNSEMIAMECNNEIVIIDNDEESNATHAKQKCKNSIGRTTKNISTDEGLAKELTSTANSLHTNIEANKQRRENGLEITILGFPPGQPVHQKNGAMPVSTSCSRSEPSCSSICQAATSIARPRSQQPSEGSNPLKASGQVTAACSDEPNLSVNATIEVTIPTESSTHAQAIQESVITNSGVNGSVTAVTRSLSNAPIMSTNQISTGVQQHQTMVPQMPVLNFGGAVNLMQGPMHQLITINDQGMPMLQMVAGTQQMGSGQVIVNGTPTQNLLVMGNTSASAPNTMNSNMNSVGMNQQTFNVAGHPGVPASGMHLDCQSGQPQNFVQTDAGLFHQTMCGRQAMRQTAQCIPNLAGTFQQLQATNPTNPQMQLMTSSMNAQMNSQIIPAQNGGVVLSGSMPGPQQQQHNHNNALLTVNSTSNSSNLPSALMLPNGQIIPVVREPSLLYPNSASLGGNLLMSAAPSNVPQVVFSSQSCQTQTSVSTTMATQTGRPLTATCEFSPGTSAAALVGCVPQIHNSAVQVSGGPPIMPSRPLATDMAAPLRSSSNVGFCERNPSVSLSTSTTTDIATMHRNTLDIVSSSCPVKMPNLGGAKQAQNASKKSKVTTKRAQRTIKPKPAQSVSSTSSSSSPSTPAAPGKDNTSPVIPAVSSVATTLVNFSTHFSTTSNMPAKDVIPTTSVDYSSNTSSPDTVTSTTTKSSTKKQVNSRPANIMNDILAQATESIFSNSISDISSSPNPHYFGNSGSNSNSSHAIFTQDIAIDPDVHGKKGPVQGSFTAALIMDASKSTCTPKNAESDMIEVSPERRQSGKSETHAADILGSLAGEMYRTTNNESSTASSFTSVTASNISNTCSTFGPRNITVAISASSLKDNSFPNALSSAISSASATASSEMTPSITGSSSNVGTPNLVSINSSPSEGCGSAVKEKRGCTDDLPISKRSRASLLSVDCSPIAESRSIKEIGGVNKLGPEELPSIMPALPVDSSSTTVASNSVNFVSISQLASSASKIATTSSSTLGTFANSMMPTIAPFSIDTGTSNDNSPLCSISPLLSSPNKNSDLAFTLSAAISDLPRSDEASFLEKQHASGEGNSVSVTSEGNNLALTSSIYANVPHNFGSPSSVPLPSPSATTFCVPESNNHSGITSNSQSSFGSLSYPGPAAMSRTNFNGISNLQNPVSLSPVSASSGNSAPGSFFDKNHKLHALHYNNRQDEMSTQRHSQLAVSSHNSLSQVSSGNNLHFHTSHLPLPFSQAYSMPLSHHSSLQSPRPPVPNLNISHNDTSKSKSNSQRRSSINSVNGVQHNGMMSPPGMSHAQMQHSGLMHQIRPMQDAMVPGLGPPQLRPSQNYQQQRMHSLNRHSPQGGTTVPSPKMAEVHGHSPVNSRGPTASARNNGSVSPKPNLTLGHGHVSRSHPVPSPGRNPLSTTPVSSPAVFGPRRSPNVSSSESPMITSYASENSTLQNQARELNFHPGQKQLTHLPIISTMNTTTTRPIISYSAESLIQTQTNHRPNCAREGHSALASVSGRQLALGPNGHNGSNVVPCPTSNALHFAQGAGNRNAGEDVHQAGFPYFPPFQQHPTNEQMVSHQLPAPPPLPHSSNTHKHIAAQNHSGMNKACGMRATPDNSQAIQLQPNFSFSLLQHSQPGTEGLQQQQVLQPHQQHDAVPDGASNAMRHNNSYMPMGNYGGQGPTVGPMSIPTSLQGPTQKDAQMSKAPMSFPCMPPFPHNQGVAGQSPNIRQAANNSFLCQSGINGMNFPEVYATQNNLRTEGANAGGGNGSNPNVQVPEKVGNAPYKSRNVSANKQDGAPAAKSSKTKQQSKKKHHQYSVEEVNLSNSIFETGRSLTPYFTIPNLSPPRNEVPTYIPNPNPLFNAPQRALAPNGPQQSKTTDLGAPYGPLFTPRTQSGLNLNLQAPGFCGFGNGSMPNQMPSHSGGVNVAGHVPNFNLSNIFPDINNSNESISISPIKFHHGNHILPPPQPGMEHNLQHHHQSAPLYHKRGHPSSVIHNGMTINSLLGHNPHTFDGRPQVPMGINNTMTTPFHGHGHTPSFSNVIPSLNFSMHDH